MSVVAGAAALAMAGALCHPRAMRTTLFLLASVALGACGAPIPAEQPDGADCNVLEAQPCASGSFCDQGPASTAPPRMHTYGFMGQAAHAVGTCRPRGATGAPCSASDGCVSGRCVYPTPDGPGACAP